MKATIKVRQPGVQTKEIEVSGADYELHDGFAKYKDANGTWHVIPMHRIEEIEET